MAEEDDGKHKHRRSHLPARRRGRKHSALPEFGTAPARRGSDIISPLILGKNKEVDEFRLENSTSTSAASRGTKHLTGRSSHHRFVQSPRASPTLEASSNYSSSSAQQNTPADDGHHTRAVVAQAWEWLHMEKQKRKLRKHKPSSTNDELDVINEDGRSNEIVAAQARRGSSGSDTSTALEQLEEILRKDVSISSSHRRSSTRKKSSMLRKAASSLRPRRHSTTGGSSDTDVLENEISVPTCETWLDNSRTLSRTSGMSAIDESQNLCAASMSLKEREAWSGFQYEILRIAHTLQLKRWRRIPLECSDDIIVERLSGALTNAVYTVSPPRSICEPNKHGTNTQAAEVFPVDNKAQPSKLLLRIYGPQVEHLIDRDAELQILKRLGRKNIGPRLLGTFNNGRFEEYLNAKALSPTDLHQPEISRQIAKRMRELHDGIDLTRAERQSGPFVWRNWDKWIDRCERIVSYIDDQVMGDSYASPAITRLRNRGFVCGTPWMFFRKTVECFRNELTQAYGGVEQLQRELVFAHNDTQYGNILRQEPPGESPLLLPANVHKQLVVIDFEYSNANTRGLEFANHFTEWCYNYHDPDKSFECQTAYYPTLEEQRRFLKAYLGHQPHFASAETTLRSRSIRDSISSLSSFAPSSRAPSFPSLNQQQPNLSVSSMSLGDAAMSANDSSTPIPTPNPKRPETAQIHVEDQVNHLMHEARLWRIANSAQWVAWAIVQARVPGLYNEPHTEIAKDTATDWNVHTPPIKHSEQPEQASYEEEDVEFDYLSYARSRAMFFWGDCVQYGIVTEEDLSDDVREHLKVVSY